MNDVILLRGNGPKALTHATLYGAESVIFDLADSVPLQDKEEARILLKEAFAELDYSKIRSLVRINSFESKEGIKDLQAFNVKIPQFFIIPLNTLEELKMAKKQMKILEESLKVEGGTIKVIAEINTAKAYDNVKEFINRDSGLDGVYLNTDKVVQDMEMCNDLNEMQSFLACSLEITCTAKNLLFINAKEVAYY